MSFTLKNAIDKFSIDVHDHLDRETDIPVLCGLQAQGDVIVVPAPDKAASKNLLRQEGFPVVKGESGGNTHMLLADGQVFFTPSATAGADPSDLDLGTLTVAEGATAYLAHPEHAYSGIGAGTYVLRRQREQADVARFVAD